MSMQQTKAELRQHYKSKRAKYAQHVTYSYGSAMIKSLGTQLKSFKCVGAYLSYGIEPPTIQLLDFLSNKGVKILVPSISNGKYPKWSEYTAGAALLSNDPGKVPSVCDTEILEAEAIEEAQAIIVPALACDYKGVRLGQGGGWYDQALLYAQESISLIATVYDWEVPDCGIIPQENHDIKMTHIYDGITLKKTKWF